MLIYATALYCTCDMDGQLKLPTWLHLIVKFVAFAKTAMNRH